MYKRQGGDITGDADNYTFTSSTNNKPHVTLSCGGTAQIGAQLTFKRTATGADNTDIGTINFEGKNEADEDITYAKINVDTADASDGAEEGQMLLSVASHDGELQPGLNIISGNVEDEVDVTIGNGANSVVTVPGRLSIGTRIDFDSVGITAIQAASESFSDDDVSLMTSAAIDDRINAAGGGISFDGSTADGVLTYKDSDEATVEANLTFSSETLAIGANDTGIATIKRTQRTSAGNGGDLNISGGVVKSGETNENGGALTLEGGKGTGSGTGGHVKVQTYAAGSSGTSLNTTATVWQFHDTGVFETPGAIELGHASDTTISRLAEGIVGIENKQVFTTATPPLTSAAAGVPAVTMQVRRTITQAEANSMHSTPIEIVPAQGANTVITPLGGMIRIDRATTQSNSSTDWNMHYADQEPGAYLTASIHHIRRFMYNEAGDRIYHITPGLASTEVAQNLTDDVNKAVEVSFDSAATTNAFTSIDVYLTYQVFNIA